MRPPPVSIRCQKPQLRTAVGFLVAVVLAGVSGRPVHAICNVIPPSVEELRSTQGTVDRPVVAPGRVVSIRTDLACDPTRAGFHPTPAQNRVVLRFVPPQGSPTEVVVAGAPQLANCGTTRCDTLRFTVPAASTLDTALPPANDGLGLVGPAEIRVTDPSGSSIRAEIGPLFEVTRSCEDRFPEAVFGHFTVLPPPNNFAQLTTGQQTRLLATLDGRGNLLVPFNFQQVLPASSTPVARLLEGTANLVAFSSDPSQFLRIPSPLFVRAFSPGGRPAPPILEVSETGDLVYGTADAAESVLRVARRDPGDPLAPAIYDLADRYSAGGRGPIVIQSFTMASRERAPLRNLVPGSEVVAFSRGETLEGANLNPDVGDTDRNDFLAQILDVGSGRGSFTGLAVSCNGGFDCDAAGAPKPFLATGGRLAAFFESEFHQGYTDRNGDGDNLDEIFHLFDASGRDLTRERADGTGLPEPVVVTGDPAGVFDGKPLVVSNGFAFFRTREDAEKTRSLEYADGRVFGAGAGSGSLALSGDGRILAFVSNATDLVPGDTNDLADIFFYDTIAGTILERVEVPPGPAAGIQQAQNLSLSDDGRYLAFTAIVESRSPSQSTARDVFVYERGSGAPFVVGDTDASGTPYESGISGWGTSLSGDGRYVTFTINGIHVGCVRTSAVVVKDLMTGAVRTTADLGPTPCGLTASDAEISTDGRSVALRTLTGGGGFAGQEVSIWDLGTNTLVRIPLATSIGFASLSSDGRFVVFDSTSSNLVEGDTNKASDVFLHDRDTDADGIFDEPGAIRTELVSVASDGTQPDEGGRISSSDVSGRVVSDDGRYILFYSSSGDLDDVPRRGFFGIYRRDRQTGRTELISSALRGAQAGTQTASLGFQTSRDGRTVALGLTPQTILGETISGTRPFVWHDADVASLNPDADSGDRVLRVFDPGTSAFRPLAQLAASQGAVEAGRAAFLVPERSEGGTNLNPAGGDGDAADEVAHVYDAPGDSLTNLGVAGSKIAISDSTVCLTVPEASENALDRNGDADAQDEAAAAWTLGGALPPENLGVAASSIAAVGSRCVLLASEAGQAAGSLNPAADGDALDDVLQIVEPAGPGGGAPTVTNLGRAAAEFLARGDLVAFRTCEAAQGGQDLNRDGDTADCAMEIYDVETQTLTQTGYAARTCDVAGCDPFFEPYRIRGKTVSFLVDEAEQGGPATIVGHSAGCLASSPPAGCDLTGDGDDLDTVIVIFNVEAQKAQLYEISTGTQRQLSPFPETVVGSTALRIEVSEQQVGRDLNGDGDSSDFVRMLVGDADGDGILDDSLISGRDLCPEQENTDQLDADEDGAGDVACDPNPASVLPGEVPCDVNRDGVIDRTDVELVFADRGMGARTSDPRDVDGDGEVSVVDGGICAERCTNPECAPPPPPPGATAACGLLGIEPWLMLAGLRWLRRRPARSAR
jgi:hypothetical protein